MCLVLSVRKVNSEIKHDWSAILTLSVSARAVDSVRTEHYIAVTGQLYRLNAVILGLRGHTMCEDNRN